MTPITHSMQDTFARRLRAARKTLSATCNEKLDTWRRALVAWVSKLADKAALALYLNDTPSREHAPPTIHFNSPENGHTL